MGYGVINEKLIKFVLHVNMTDQSYNYSDFTLVTTSIKQ
jgi:hypothetical protein